MAVFSSAEERKRKETEYREKIFPLGIEQRELALAALRPHFRVKVTDADILYAFVVAKQKYLDAGGGIQAAQAYIKKSGIFTDEEKRRLLRLVELDAGATSLDGYPGPEII